MPLIDRRATLGALVECDNQVRGLVGCSEAVIRRG
jgi:hypothetical protein